MAREFAHGGDCEHRDLETDETCRVTVSFSRSGAVGTRNAILRIHQNLAGDPTDVPVEAEVEDGGLTATIPDVIDQDEGSARETLANFDFKVRVEDENTDDPNMDGIVVKQDPPAGATRTLGDEVTISVGRFQP